MCICVVLCLFPGKLDDEVAASVYENRGNMLDLESITQLTSDNFHTAVAQSSLTVVLFYLKCKTASLLGHLMCNVFFGNMLLVYILFVTLYVKKLPSF